MWYCIWLHVYCLTRSNRCVFVYCSSSVGTIAGAVIGGLFAFAVIVGIIVFVCVVVCKCKTTGVRGRVVQPGVGMSNNVTYINSPSAPPYNSKSFDFCRVFAILKILDISKSPILHMYSTCSNQKLIKLHREIIMYSNILPILKPIHTWINFNYFINRWVYLWWNSTNEYGTNAPGLHQPGTPGLPPPTPSGSIQQPRLPSPTAPSIQQHNQRTPTHHSRV